jgi:hypothetical protein
LQNVILLAPLADTTQYLNFSQVDLR